MFMDSAVCTCNHAVLRLVYQIEGLFDVFWLFG